MTSLHNPDLSREILDTITFFYSQLRPLTLKMIQLMKEDSVGRPIYKRKEPTSQGKQVYLYHIHQTKKWRIGPSHEGAEAHNCWLFITSKG